MDDTTVQALGKLSEALETAERARGQLYGFHQLTGRAHLMLQEAVRLFRDAGHAGHADAVCAEVLGRDVFAGRWTFQVVEEYEDGYHRCFVDLEERIRNQLAQGRRHIYEAEMRQRLHG
ncbi:MAG: hypothetical protein JWQ95_4620 [Sphaerisporangium sp.]|jgi:hypothetical protein|nr:hypothetical protein [Sphaerisporangium sp.]